MQQTARAPRLVVLEGLDGTGKTTLACKLASVVDALLLTTPPATWRAVRPILEESVRDSIRARALLYASTVQLASDQAEAALAAGRSVVVDRYFLSTAVYHVGVDLTAVAGALHPADLTVLLDLPIEERVHRLARRAGNSIDDARTLDPATDAELRSRYLKSAQHPLAGRVLVLSSGRSVDELVEVVVLEAWS